MMGPPKRLVRSGQREISSVALGVELRFYSSSHVSFLMCRSRTLHRKSELPAFSCSHRRLAWSILEPLHYLSLWHPREDIFRSVASKANALVEMPACTCVCGPQPWVCRPEKEYSHLGVFIAFYEIYCGKLFDLLNNRSGFCDRAGRLLVLSPRVL